MPESAKAQRLKEAREKAQFRSAKEAADALGIKYQTYAAHENGQRSFDDLRAQIYSRRFKVRFEWLLTGRGKRDEELILPDRLEQKLLGQSDTTRKEIFGVFEGIVDTWPKRNQSLG